MRLASAIGVGVVLAMLAAGCGSTRTVVRTVTVAAKPAAAGTADQQLYGQIKSLRRIDGHYELRFDPAWFLSGVSANVAQAEDSGMSCAPTACPPVANDNYVVDEGHRALTYIVPNGAHGTVLVKNGTTSSPFPTTTIGVRQLARIVGDRSGLELFEPLSSGVWIVVRNGTVLRFAQQYRP